MKISIDTKQLYPIFILRIRSNGKYEIPPELLKRYEQIEREWWAMQDLLRCLKDGETPTDP